MLHKPFFNNAVYFGVAMLFTVFISSSSKAQQVKSTLNPSEGNLIIEPTRIEQIRTDWEGDIDRLGLKGQLSNCQLMVQATFEGTRDESYGGMCSFNGGNQPRQILICNDTMIGKLTIKAWGFAETPSDVLEFTRKNCPAGG